MLPEAGAFELIFLAAVALIVVGPKDLPVLLRKVGQFTAKMRGLAAEFRASFDEMARQSELDELRKEVEALRTGQLMSSTPAVESHVGEINDHLSHNYWDGAAQAEPVQAYVDPYAGALGSEGDETAALPPPGSRTPPLPKPTRKRVTTSKAPVVTGPSVTVDTVPAKARARASRTSTPQTAPGAQAPADVAAKTPRKRAAKAPTSTEAAEI